MGGPDLVERQHSLGKLSVRERLDLLFDEGTFVETGLYAEALDSPQSAGKRTPADGCVTVKASAPFVPSITSTSAASGVTR